MAIFFAASPIWLDLHASSNGTISISWQLQILRPSKYQILLSQIQKWCLTTRIATSLFYPKWLNDIPPLLKIMRKKNNWKSEKDLVYDSLDPTELIVRQQWGIITRMMLLSPLTSNKQHLFILEWAKLFIIRYKWRHISVIACRHVRVMRSKSIISSELHYSV